MCRQLAQSPTDLASSVGKPITRLSAKGQIARLALNCVLWRALKPMNGRAPFMHRAVPQEQIDKILIWHAQLGRHFFEVINGRAIEANRDLALKLLSVRIFS